jgi:hypothetical protein
MPSAWIVRRSRRDGGTTYRVLYRLGGRESTPKHGGSFRTMREATVRRNWLAGELAAMRVPDILLLDASAAAPTLATVAVTWLGSRIDVADGTMATYRVNLGRILARLGTHRVDGITPADVAELAADLAAEGLARESIRKTLVTFSMVLDFAGVLPNPVRDNSVKLPREVRPEINPPTAEHVLAVHRLLPPRYRLPLLVLDSTGMRVGELEQLTQALARVASGLEDRPRSLGHRSGSAASRRTRSRPERRSGRVCACLPRHHRRSAAHCDRACLHRRRRASLLPA